MRELSFGRGQDRPAEPTLLQGTRGISDLIKSFPSVAETSSPAEGQQGETYSLFVPTDNKVYRTYQDVAGRVVSLGHGLPRIIDKATRDTYSETRQIPIGSYSTTIELPDRPEGLVTISQALIPAGIQALRRGRSVAGVTWRDRENEVYKLNVYENPIADISQGRKDELSAKYYAARSLLEAPEPLVGRMVSQDFAARAETIERDKVLRIVSGSDPSIEDAYHRFGSFDTRLLFPSLQEVNASPLTFKKLQELYAERIAALRDGYVTMDKIMLEEEKGEPLLPSLSSLYKVYELRQAGFAVKLAEAESPRGFGNTDHPTQRELAVMAKPMKSELLL